MPDTPAPIEIAQTHDATIASGTCAACAAWKKMTSGPAYEISTARNPAATAARPFACSMDASRVADQRAMTEADRLWLMSATAIVAITAGTAMAKKL